MSPDDEVIHALYAAVTNDDAFGRVLEALARRFGCPSSALLYVDRRHPSAEIAVSYGIAADPDVQRRYREHYAADDPAPAAMAALALGRAAATDRLFDADARANSRFFTEFYQPLGLREALGGPIVDGAGRFGVVAVHRGPDRPPFGDDEIAALERLLPHIIRAAELRLAFFALETRGRSLEMALEPMGTGVLALDETGRLIHGNRTARAILDRSDVLTLDPAGRIRARSLHDDPMLQVVFGGRGPEDETALLHLRKTDGSPGLLAALRRDASRGPRGKAVLTLHLSEPGREIGDVAAQLERTLGLRRSASLLVLALLNGDDLNGYAERTGLSINTVRSHLQAAFAATGCRRQADLVRIAGTIVRDLTLEHAEPDGAAAAGDERKRRALRQAADLG